MDGIVPGELRNVDVQFISLVDRGANKRTFKIFKSADCPEDGNGSGMSGSGSSQEDEVRGLFHTLKAFFTRKQEAGRLPTFQGVHEQREATDDLIRVEKIGRKIAAPRLKALRDAYALIGQVLAETDDEGKEETEVTKDEVAKLIGEEVQKALGPVVQRVEKLENPEKPKEEPKHEEVTKEEVTKAIGEEIQKALQPIVARLEKVEQVRGLGNAAQPETQIQKSAPDWGGIFL